MRFELVCILISTQTHSGIAFFFAEGHPLPPYLTCHLWETGRSIIHHGERRGRNTLSLINVAIASSATFGVGVNYLRWGSTSRNLGLMRISRLHFKQSKNCSFISRIYVLRSFVNFWVIFGDIWEEMD